MRTRLTATALALCLFLPAGVAEASSSLWSGYRITPARTADGGFMGARLIDGRISYRTDARAKNIKTGYRKVHRVKGDRQVARAAWILSKYGDVRVADQSAAVDVATYALLSRQGLDSRRTRARLRSTGHAAAIRSLARVMLRGSRQLAGPYALTVTTTPAEVGGQNTVVVRVRSAAGNPVAGLPVLVSLPGIAETHDTSAKGRVTVRFPADQVGLRRLTVAVRKVPEWRLLLRSPRRKAASRIAVAGRKATLTARGVVAVRATPTVAVIPSPVPRRVDRGFATGFTVSGGEGVAGRTVTSALFGPFAKGAAVSCSGTPARTVTSTVNGDGSYSTGAVRVGVPGLYFWRVQVGANQLNAPAEACGGAVRVRSKPTFTLDAQPGSKLDFTVRGLPAGYDDLAVLSLYGPYAEKGNAGCGKVKLVDRVTRRVTRNGAFTSPKIAISKRGYYTWKAQLPEGYLAIASGSGCATPGSFVRIR